MSGALMLFGESNESGAHRLILVAFLKKLTRSVDEERASRAAEEELLYTSCVAQRRRKTDHRKQFLSFRYIANTTSSPAMFFQYLIFG